jgi:hypothetical protein
MTVPLKWRQHIEAWQQSGLSQAIYCKQQHLKMSTFSARLSEYRRLNQSQAAELIPVQIEPVAPIPTSLPGLVLIHNNGHRLELPTSVSVKWLAELLKCLG